MATNQSYYQSDSLEILSFSKYNNGLSLDLHFNKMLNYDHYFQDLETTFLEARSDGIELDSIKRITMNFFSYFENLTDEFSTLEGIQKEMVEQKKDKRPFLNHRLIGTQLKKSKNIHKLILLLGKDPTEIPKIIVEKCHSTFSINSSKAGEHRLHCAHLVVYLN